MIVVVFPVDVPFVVPFVPAGLVPVGKGSSGDGAAKFDCAFGACSLHCCFPSTKSIFGKKSKSKMTGRCQKGGKGKC